MHRFQLVAALLIVVLAGCTDKKKKAPPPPPTVQVAHPLQQQVVDWDEYVGRFESINQVDLRPRVSGYLQTIAFRDGDHVRRGQLLFVIDPRPYRAALDQAKAQTSRAQATLENARIELERARALLAAKAASQQQFEARRVAEQQAQADLEAAQAAQATAALNLNFTRIEAPLSGRISDRQVATGNLVTADQTVLTTIVDLDPIRFGFESSEALYLRQQRQRGETGPKVAHHSGDEVQVQLQDETDYPRKGHIEFIDNRIDPNSGVIRGRAVFHNPGDLLTPGMFGHMRAAGTRPYAGLLVPDSVVTSDQNRQIVLVVGDGDKVRQQTVEPGPLVDGLRVIRSGLKPDDRVIVAGQVAAKPGKKVTVQDGRITPSKEAPPPSFVPPPADSATTG
ncbi:MAG: efflux RND transporter periplasmic adaptor subunit [Janthinobacterium lividum]